MNEVFTRRPAAPPVSTAARDQANDRSLPGWALNTGGEPAGAGGFAPLIWAFALAVVVTLAVAAAWAPSPLSAGWIARVALMAVWVGACAILLARLVRLSRKLKEAERWNHTLFERTGIALWREDWSVARDAVLKLMKSGVRDMEGYFAAHPDEARAIRKGVIIKDVNQFAVTRINAPSKSAVLGSLDSLLPDTDQTFIQWLTGFERGDLYYRSETHLTRPDGSHVDTLFTAALPTDMKGFEDILVSDLDITEFKTAQAKLAAAEAEIARASRVTTLGALSASIAHEVNSPLAAIISHAEASLRWLNRPNPEIEEAKLALDCVLTDAARAQGVVERTRAYLSNRPPAATPHSLAQIAREAIMLIERELIAYGASVHLDAPDGLPPVLADPVNIQQVFVNLLMNGAQAMSEKIGPRDLVITIRQEGAMVRADVSDRGGGIPAERQRSIFEPFYSTKDDGMGMGLAICKTCVAAHGGRLSVSSEQGLGSTFTFTLPMV